MAHHDQLVLVVVDVVAVARKFFRLKFGLVVVGFVVDFEGLLHLLAGVFIGGLHGLVSSSVVEIVGFLGESRCEVVVSVGIVGAGGSTAEFHIFQLIQKCGRGHTII